MSKSEEAKQLARDVEQSNNENASELKGAMNGGCSPELSKQVTGTMVSVMGVVDKVNRALTTTGGSEGGNLFSDDSLQKIYENAKNTPRKSGGHSDCHIAQTKYFDKWHDGIGIYRQFLITVCGKNERSFFTKFIHSSSQY